MDSYEKKALEFLYKTGCTLSIAYVDTVIGFPFDNDGLQHNQYKVTLRRGDKEYIFPFYGSYHDFLEDRAPGGYDVLACLDTYVPDSIWGFIDEYGYEIRGREDGERVERIYSECVKQRDALMEMFSDEELEMLAGIF